MARHSAAPYAERLSLVPGAFDLGAIAAWGTVDARLAVCAGIQLHARQVRALAGRFARLSDGALLAEAAMLRPVLLRGAIPAPVPDASGPATALPRVSGMFSPRVSDAFSPRVSDTPRTRVFALVHAAVERHLGMRYHAVQLAGGRALTGRRIVEMATGEGKTITAILPAALAALSGRPVHVVTVNDYLAERDANRLRPVYAALGLTVGLVKQGDDVADRRRAYAEDITYVTNKELAFDYLKDRIATAAARGSARHAVASLFGPPRGGLILRGLHVAIVDEADSVLIDEARTPLIISADRPDEHMAEIAGRALDLARGFTANDHYILDETSRAVHLTAQGRERAGERAGEMAGGMTGIFRARQAREQIVSQALSALHLFQRDQHYIVLDGKVQIVDEYTGRTMPDRTWEQGLHQLIEAKEGLELSGARETLARITYQRFFNRYLQLSGMTGTGREVAGELRAVYGLRVVRLPTNRPPRRRYLGGTLTRDSAARWATVADRSAAVAARGRPVLVGTRSVEESEALAAVLTRRGLPHVVLNARQDADEAAVIAAAGSPGRITVATNMAGRGTDIELAPGVAKAGGLHVILTGYHDSTRIDRQLFGRAGRQGDPGTCESVATLDDPLFRRFAPALTRLAARGWLPLRLMLALLRRGAQGAASRANARQRRHQVIEDERLEKGLGFTGRE